MGKLDANAQYFTSKVAPWDYLRPWKPCWNCDGREVLWNGAAVVDCKECETGYHPDRRPWDFFLWIWLCFLRLFAGTLSLAFAIFLLMYMVYASG